ncbi:MAG: hypothetical protein HY001_03090 [Candidatus Portnoybacteria bacterium]|nr:hypothetical protein [Candidatus Portnoybacteria bacterium]
MGFFDQAKLAANLMKNMDPSQMKEMLSQAKEAQKMMEEQIRKVVDEEIAKRNLVSREEVEAIIREINSKFQAPNSK